MTPDLMDALLNNEKEWRQYVVVNVEKIKDEMSAMKAWSLVFRIIGGSLIGGLFAVVLIIVEKVINQ